MRKLRSSSRRPKRNRRKIPALRFRNSLMAFPKEIYRAGSPTRKSIIVAKKEKWVKERRIIYDPNAAETRDYQITYKEFRKAFKSVIGA
mmetsp:Transcript_83786/g.132818  ORF Transcript_83786/g.132818 Transcript_83786/m.132818 type:complete len:89 (-) Transcript_83786:77-343(-)